MAEKSDAPDSGPEVPQTRAPESAPEAQPEAVSAAEPTEAAAANSNLGESATAKGPRSGQRPRPTKRAATPPAKESAPVASRNGDKASPLSRGKSSETKSPRSKPSGAKTSGTKASAPKASEAKASGAKAAEAKSSGSKVAKSKSSGSKVAKSKSSGEKVAEPKTSVSKASVSKASTAKASTKTSTNKASGIEASAAQPSDVTADPTESTVTAEAPPAPQTPAWRAGFESTAIPGAWLDAAWDALRRPDQPPQRLAGLAVAELGPRAAAWSGWLRRTYPDPPLHGLVRLALHDATRISWGLALAEAGGPLVAPVRLIGSAWIRATVVLRVAAAYGYDPADPRRADDLIELFGLNPELSGDLVSMSRVTGAAGQLGLVRTVISRLGLRKGVSAGAVRALIAVSEHEDQLTKLAYRAVRYYRPGKAASTEASSESTSSRNTL